ncbi:MAG: hypothetical protein K2Q22_11220 [Cytophagales bacterium]|nr:hypothetical protein [Cytophagales bacterium]
MFNPNIQCANIVGGLIICILSSLSVFAQKNCNDSTILKEGVSDIVKEKATFPEIKGYVGLVHPIYTFSNDGNVSNFKDYYLVGNPWGINIWKSKKFGFTFEFTPFVKTDTKGSKVNNILFHPGILYRLGNDFTFVFRLAYETSGRYGITPIINKVLWRGKDTNFFVAVLLPTRFGNNQAPSATVAFQFGLGF